MCFGSAEVLFVSEHCSDIQKPEIPLHGCISECLKKISKIRPLVLKTFNYLTDVLNNPEHGTKTYLK